MCDSEEILNSNIRALATETIETVDLRDHEGIHPRIGALDVVPFVSLERDERGFISNGSIESAISARNLFMAWAARTLDLPCFSYGPERSLPEVRRDAFRSIKPDTGPDAPHPTAGASAVGARPILVAYNVWLTTTNVDLARSIAKSIRAPSVRALGMQVVNATQVSCNLIDPFETGPEPVYDAIARLAESAGASVIRGELVGLAPTKVVEAIPQHRRAELGLSPEQTLEARLEGSPVL